MHIRYVEATDEIYCSWWDRLCAWLMWSVAHEDWRGYVFWWLGSMRSWHDLPLPVGHPPSGLTVKRKSESDSRWSIWSVRSEIRRERSVRSAVYFVPDTQTGRMWFYAQLCFAGLMWIVWLMCMWCMCVIYTWPACHVCQPAGAKVLSLYCITTCMSTCDSM